MSPVAVVSDSPASIPESLLEELGLHVVAYDSPRGQEVLRDLVTVDRNEFLRWMHTGPGAAGLCYFSIE